MAYTEYESFINITVQLLMYSDAIGISHIRLLAVKSYLLSVCSAFDRTIK